jgi:hypothetical protein
MSTERYYGEQDNRHGGALSWPGVNGYPFRGQVPMLKPEEMQVLAAHGLVGDAHHRTFCLSDAADNKDYSWVRERIRNGWFTQDHVERWRTDDAIHIYLEWTQLYIEVPRSRMARPISYGHQNAFTLRESH